jgi:UDP-N-acetylmuramate--alanine ligase
MKLNWASKNIFFIGIGGSGMAPLATLLYQMGAQVSGSDRAITVGSKQLERLGIPISYEQTRQHWDRGDMVVFSSGIAPEHKERSSAAMTPGVMILHRSQLLAMVARDFELLVVAGSHGKTTTSGALAYLLDRVGCDIKHVLGGYYQQRADRIENIKRSYEAPKTPYLVIEADESDGTLMRYQPQGAIITHIGDDHLSFYGRKEGLSQIFSAFAEKITRTDLLFVCSTSPCHRDIMQQGRDKIGQSYGWYEEDDWRIQSYCINDQGLQQWSLKHNQRDYGPFTTRLIGKHNVENLSGVIAMTLSLGISQKEIQRWLPEYRGMSRRQEVKQVAPFILIDDYAHHPTEISCTIKAVQDHYKKHEVVVVLQIHRYSRFLEQYEAWNSALKGAERLVVTDIYAAGEDESLLQEDRTLQHWIQANQAQLKIEYCQRDDLESYICQRAHFGQVWLLLGAGDITYAAKEIAQQLSI